MGTGSVGGAPMFWTWLGGALGSVENVVATQQEKEIEEEAVSLSKAKKAIERDICALLLPMPQANVEALLNVFAGDFSIDRLSSATPYKNIGIFESSIIMAAVGEWAKDPTVAADLAKDLLSTDQKNPINVILGKFVEAAELKPVDALQIQRVLQNMPVVPAVLRTADPNLLEKAFVIAQQQIVLAMLDAWVAQEARRAEQAKKEAKEDQIEAQEIANELLRQYIKECIQKKATLVQPSLSIAYATAFFGPSLIPAISESQNVGTILGILNTVPRSLRFELGLIAAGCVSTAQEWAKLLTISMARLAHGSGQQLTVDAARALAMSLIALLQSPVQIAVSRIGHAVDSGLLSKDRSAFVYSAFTSSLLIHAMAVLYRAQLGGVTAEELRALLDGTTKLEKGDLLATLVTMVSNELRGLSSKDKEDLIDDLLRGYNRSFSPAAITQPIEEFATNWQIASTQETPPMGKE